MGKRQMSVTEWLGVVWCVWVCEGKQGVRVCLSGRDVRRKEGADITQVWRPPAGTPN